MLTAWSTGAICLVISPRILEGYRRTWLALSTGREPLAGTPEAPLAMLTAHARLVDAPPLDERAGEDPDDEMLLAAALAANGRLLTGRDAAHMRIADLFACGQGLPTGVDFTNRVIDYVGPGDPVRDEAVGPAGPTTATRMDTSTEMMLEKTGLITLIGKGERGPTGVDAIRKHRAAYLMAVRGAACLVSKAIRSSRDVAF